MRQERPELRIVDRDTWDAVQTKLEKIRDSFGGPRRPPRGGARPLYSRYLLTGLLRCSLCGARMRAQTATKRKGDRTYRAGWYRCSFAADKGPAVCTHRKWYRQDRLEGALIAKFREAMTPERVDAVVSLVNAGLDQVAREHANRVEAIKAEILKLERQAGSLARFIADAGDSPAVREELRGIESGPVRSANSGTT